MARVLTMPMFLTALLMSACGGWFEEAQYSAGLRSFRITEAVVDPENGELTLKWAKAYGADMYRVWLSRSSNCSDRMHENSVEGTSRNFGKLGPGSFFACVEAIMDVNRYGTNSCNAEVITAAGRGIKASNQGKPVTTEAALTGSWKKLGEGYRGSRLVGNQGGIFVETSLSRLHVLNHEGQLKSDVTPLKAVTPQKVYYAYAQDKLLGIVSDSDRTQVFQWDPASQQWIVQQTFSQYSVLGFHLSSPNELIVVLKDVETTQARWLAVNPADPSVIQTLSEVSLTSQLGNTFYNFASVHLDGAFIIADDRGLFQLSRSEIVPLLAATGMAPMRIFAFPGAEHEILIMGQAWGYLDQAQLLCSPAWRMKMPWYSWNRRTQRFSKLEADQQDFLHAVGEGPLGLTEVAGGRFLEVLGQRPRFFTAPPFADGRLLDGLQLPANQLLVVSGDELWLFVPETKT